MGLGAKEIKRQKAELREMTNRWIEAASQLGWIQEILDGEEPDDFAMSFPIVREVWDLKHGSGLPFKGTLVINDK